jgi:hypothetical protein
LEEEDRQENEKQVDNKTHKGYYDCILLEEGEGASC